MNTFTTLLYVIVTFFRLLALCVRLAVCRKQKRYHCYWHCLIYARKFACDTNLVSPKTRQVSYKFLLQKRLFFFYRRHSSRKIRRTVVSHFSLYHRSTCQTKFGSLSARTRGTFISVAQFPFTVTPTPGLMITQVTMQTRSFVSSASPKGDCLNFFF